MCLAPANRRALVFRASSDAKQGVAQLVLGAQASPTNRARTVARMENRSVTAPNTQTGGGSGSGGSGGQGSGAPSVIVNAGGTDERGTVRDEAREEANEFWQGLLREYGTKDAAVRALISENADRRIENRTLKKSLAEVTAKVPADGSRVLSADDGKVWDAIKTAAGTDLAKVPDRIKRAGELETQLAEAEFGKLVEQGATAVKFNPTVLKSLLKDKGYTLEMRDMLQSDGKTTVKIPFIRKAGDEKAAWEKLDAAAEQQFKDFLPALKALPQGGNAASGGGSGGGEHIVASHEMPSQSSASSQGGGGGGSVVDQHIARQKTRSERPNPLKPVAPAAKK